jgi:nucleoside-diphosphate-sugar epimerase
MLRARILQCLLARGDDVGVVLRPGTADGLPYGPLLREVIEAAPGSSSEAEATLGVDVVYDLGAPMSPGSADTTRSMTAETARFLEACRGAGIERYVFVSTVAVYAPAPYPWMWPIREDSRLEPHGDQNLYGYGETRLEIERLLRAAGEQARLEYAILRPSAVYGAGAPWARQWLRQLAQRPRGIVGLAGEGVHMQWVNVRDIADALALAGVRPEAANEVFNVAGSELFTRDDIAAVIDQISAGLDRAAASWSRWAHQRRDFSLGRNGSGLKYDISKARAKLGFSPKVRLHDGISEVFDSGDYGMLGFDDG